MATRTQYRMLHAVAQVAAIWVSMVFCLPIHAVCTGATPVFSASPLTGPAPLTVTFSVTQDFCCGVVVWGDDGGDSICRRDPCPPDNGHSYSHTYANEGTYTAEYTAGNCLSSKARQTIVVTPPLDFSDLQAPAKTLDFGTVEVGASRTQPLKVVNNGTGPTTAKYTSLIGQGHYRFSVSDEKLLVTANGTADLDITFTPAAPDSYSVVLQLDFGDRFFETTLLGVGKAPPPPPSLITTPADTLRFDGLRPGSTRIRELTISNPGGLDLVDTLSLSGNGFSFAATDGQLAPLTVGADSSAVVPIAFTPTAFIPYAGILTHRTNDPDRPVVETALIGYGEYEVSVQPLSLSLGPIGVGETVTGHVTVDNLSDQPLELSARLVGAGFALPTPVYQILVEGNAAAQIPIDFTPASTGVATGLMKIAIGEEEIEVELQGTGSSEPPRISIATSTIDFDLAATGRESTVRKIRVRNVGGRPLEIYDLSSSRRQYRIAQADSLPVLIPAGGERHLHVYFKPTDIGTVRADLTLFTNDPEDEEVIIRLRGEGEDAGEVTLQVITDEVMFSSLDENSVGRASLVVRNSGRLDGEVSIVADDAGVTALESAYAILAGRSVRIPLRFDARRALSFAGHVLVEDTYGLAESITVPWRARRMLTLIDTEPLKSARNVALSTDIVLYFSSPLATDGALPVLDARLRPQALSGPLVDDLRVSSSRRIVTIPVELAAGTFYYMTIDYAKAADGGELPTRIGRGFSTGAEALYTGGLSGRALLDDGTIPVGNVYLANRDKVVMAETAIAADGTYMFEEVPAGEYRVYAQEPASATSGGFDLDDDGNLDVVQVRTNRVSQNIDIMLVADAQPAVTADAPATTHRWTVDLDEAPGDQGIHELTLSPGATFTVAAYIQDAEQLTGFNHITTFDTTQLALVQIDAEQVSEGNVLQQADGTALFLRDAKASNAVQYGGATLAPTATTAVTGDGLLSVWTFRTRDSFDKAAEIALSDLVVRTLDDKLNVSQVLRVVVEPVGAGALFSPIQMDLDGTAGNQGLKSIAVVPGTSTILELHYEGTTAIRGFGAKLEYDYGLVEIALEAFETQIGEGSLPLTRSMGDGVVEIGAVLMDDSAFDAMQVATVPLTLLGEITEPTQVILTEVTLNLADGPDQRIATNEVIVLEPDAFVKGDFDGNGKVDFLDFFAFADAFGNPDADPIYDLDDSGSVDFLDFFAFADAFGKEGRGKLMALAREVLALPDQPSISTSYPNPFNSSTTIEYFTNRDGPAVLEIYSLGGQRLRTLVNGLHPAGRHQAYWNGEDDQGRPVSSGMYLIRLQSENQVRHHKVTLIK